MAKGNIKDLEAIKSNFLMVASHQLKTPLNVIRLNLEMILHGDLGKVNKDIKASLVEIAKMDNKALELVNDFLNAASLDSKIATKKSIEIDAVKSIKDIIKEMQILARQHNVKINFIVEPKNLKILIKANYFEEVVKNLLSNAIKYNKPNGLAEVKLEKLPHKLKLSIRDEGIGIAPADQKKLFGKFFRADNAVKKATEGSGLGLFIVKSYIDNWGGKISCASQSNNGTVFTIEIPIK